MVLLDSTIIFRTIFKCCPLLLIMSENNDENNKKKNFTDDL